MAVVFPKNAAVDALLSATAAFADQRQALSKEHLEKLSDAAEGVRQKALSDDVSVL